MTAILFRAARETDAMAVRLILINAVARHPHFNQGARESTLRTFGLAQLEVLTRQDPTGLILAEVDGEIGGFAILMDDCGTLYVPWVCVDPAVRARGLGPLLYQAVFAEARRRGYPKVWGVSLSQSRSILRHLTRVGGNIVGEMKNHWNGQDYLYWDMHFDDPRVPLPPPEVTLRDDA